MADFPEYSLKDMAFDPYKRLLFLTIDAPPLSCVMIVRVNYGAGAAPVDPAVGSDVITPDQGGAFAASDRSAEPFFSAGVVDDTALVGYREGHPTVSAQGDALTSLSATNELVSVRDFQVSAVISDTGTPVNEFNSFYQIDINYTEKEIAGAVESTLALFRWDGGQWQRESSGYVLASSNVLTAYPTQPGLFAVMGETLRSYLPVVIR
jgi:hypothetical protein